jgi:hypothetical protein
MKEFESKEGFPPSPFAKYQGQLMFGEHPVDCYVLDTGARVVAMRGAVKAIAKTDTGDLAEYLGVKSLKPYINSDLSLAENQIIFSLPGVNFLAKGITSDGFVEICNAYVRALGAGALKSPRQIQIAAQCGILLGGFAKVGLAALIDEATGYQEVRSNDALQVKLAAYLSEELAPWRKFFPDKLWEEFGRLTKWQGPLHLRPQWWGKLVNELIYQALDEEVAAYLKENKPSPRYGQNYHQYFSDDFGTNKLREHISIVLGMAYASRTIDELRRRVAYRFHGKPCQEYLY